MHNEPKVKTTKIYAVVYFNGQDTVMQKLFLARKSAAKYIESTCIGWTKVGNLWADDTGQEVTIEVFEAEQ